MAKKILAVVEGEKKEPEILAKLLSIYALRDREIVSYKANIYDLYDKLFALYGDNVENVDIQEFLKESSDNDDVQEILDDRYTDILLVFDFDPQDNRYSGEKLIRMLQIFSDSTQLGRLYINYPMVESFYHFRSLDDKSFLEETYTLPDVSPGSVYKKIVADVSCIHQLQDMDKKMISKMIRLIMEKVMVICNGRNVVGDLYELLLEVACQQMDLLKHNKAMWVLNTCVLYVYEYNPRMLEWLNRR